MTTLPLPCYKLPTSRGIVGLRFAIRPARLGYKGKHDSDEDMELFGVWREPGGEDMELFGVWREPGGEEWPWQAELIPDEDS